MSPVAEVTTERLLLRPWRDADREPFAALNADPEVTEHFPAPLDPAASDALVDRFVARAAASYVTPWAVEVRATSTFVGFTGLNELSFTTAFTSPEAPAVEVGWRLARSAWGHGYASEAARAALAYGFGPAGLDEIVSFTSTTNLRSQAVMRRIGMHTDPAEDFDHPGIAAGHRLERHVLYRLTRVEWEAAARKPLDLESG